MASSTTNPEPVAKLDLFTQAKYIISLNPSDTMYISQMAYYQSNPGEFKVTYCEQEGITAYFFVPAGYQPVDLVWKFGWVGVYELEKILTTTFVDNWSSRLFTCPRVSTLDPLPFPNHWQMADFGCNCG